MPVVLGTVKGYQGAIAAGKHAQEAGLFFLIIIIFMDHMFVTMDLKKISLSLQYLAYRLLNFCMMIWHCIVITDSSRFSFK
jgi:hypothetical protein